MDEGDEAIREAREVAVRLDEGAADSRLDRSLLQTWRALAAAEQPLLDHFDRAGRRYFIVASASSSPCSPRERLVLAHIARGLSYKETAYELGLTANTVSSHVNNAMRHLGLQDRCVLTELLFVPRLEDREVELEELRERLDLRATKWPRLGLLVLSHRLVPLDLRAAAPLTDAELDVAELAARGRTNNEIAAIRGTSVRTIANQMAAILRKMGLGSRRELSTRFAPDVVAMVA